MYFTKTEDGTYVEVTEKLYPEAEVKSIKDKNKELRDTNVQLVKSNESLSAFAEVLDGVQNLTPQKLTEKIEEKARSHAEKLVTDMKTNYETQLTEANQKLVTHSQHLNKLVIGQEVQKAGAKFGVAPTAFDDVYRRATDVFEVKEGVVSFKQEKLDATGKPYTVEAWMAEQAKSAPHLFVAPQGAPAQKNATIRGGSLNTSEKRNGMEMIAAGLSSNSGRKTLN